MDKGFWEYLTSGDAASAVEGMDEPMFAIQARKNIDKGNYKEAEEYIKNGSTGVATGLALAVLPYILPELTAGSGYAGAKLATDPGALKILFGKIPAWLKHLYAATTGATTAYEIVNGNSDTNEWVENSKNDTPQEKAMHEMPGGLKDSLKSYSPRTQHDSLKFLNRLDFMGRYSPANLSGVNKEANGDIDYANNLRDDILGSRYEFGLSPKEIKEGLDGYKNYTPTPVLAVIPDTKEEVKVIQNSPEASKARKIAAPFLYGAHEFSNWGLNHLTPWGLLGGSK